MLVVQWVVELGGGVRSGTKQILPVVYDYAGDSFGKLRMDL